MAERLGEETQPAVEDQKLTREEWWDLIESLKGSWTGQLEQYGGAEEFVRKLRSDDENAFG